MTNKSRHISLLLVIVVQCSTFVYTITVLAATVKQTNTVEDRQRDSDTVKQKESKMEN